jgi:exodeoxyribonuclease VII large subunit
MATAPQVRQWPSAERPWTVSELTYSIKAVLEDVFVDLWVCGEVADLSRAQSGHIYMTLKDDGASLRAVIWRSTAASLKFDVEDGQQVICFGHLDVYPPRGTYQLVIQRIEPLGLGLWQLRLRQLHDRLAREGLFDPAHKKPLPKFPRLIGLITSPSGAAIHDFLEVLRTRWKPARVLVFPARVQGDGAAEDVIAAIRLAHQLRQRPDVLVIARGGGSIEDLWCFNDESLVREIYAAEIPVVSAIGHEIDVTLCDLVADLRALTPTEAAQRVVPSQQELLQWLKDVEARLRQGLDLRVKHARQLLEQLTRRPVLARPMDWLYNYANQVDLLAEALRRGVQHVMDRSRQVAAENAARLEALNPLATLQRGYSITLTESGVPIRAARDVAVGDRIESILAEGRLISRVEQSLDGTRTKP